MNHDPTPTGHWPEYERVQAHSRGDHTRCRPGTCKAATGTPPAPRPHAHRPDPTTAVGYSDGSAWTAAGVDPAAVPCGGCTATLQWTKHPDRDQWGWKA